MATKTAINLIEGAYRDITIKSEFTDLQDGEIADGIDQLNEFMFSQDADGLKLGYTEINDKDELITTPDYTWGMMRKNLAILLGAKYLKPVAPAVFAAAKEYTRIVVKRYTSELMDAPVQFPTTLPTGSGNNQGREESQPYFFPDLTEDHILTAGGTGLGDQTAAPLEKENES